VKKDRETGYFDFIHQYDTRLNVIYRQWEEQIAIQSSGNKSQSLFVRHLLSKKSLAAGGIAVAIGSLAALFQYGSARMNDNLIHANSHKIEAIAEQLNQMTYYQNRSYCLSDNHIYELASGTENQIAMSNQPRGFIAQPNSFSLIRHSMTTQKPDAYFHLNPYSSLLFGSIKETNGTLTAESSVVALDPYQEPNGDRRQVVDVQSSAIDLNQEFISCLNQHHDTNQFGQ
jgi:hypothetical protein